MRSVLLILGLAVASAVFAQPAITDAEYFIGTDPGEGFATAITVPTPGSSVNLTWAIPTSGLSPNLYGVMLRVRDNSGRWSKPNAHYLIVMPGNHTPLLVTQFEWAVDNSLFTAVDVPDANSVNISQLLSTVSLTPGILHKVLIRVTDNTGRVGQPHVGFLAVAPLNEAPRLVTQFEFAVDGGPPTPVDIPDASPALLAYLLSTAGLTPGTMHAIRFRITDDLGRISQFTNTLLPILPVADLTRNVVSYEYWVDSNPPTLVDAMDAPIINISELISTGAIPVGLHFVNYRTIDDLGRTGKEHRTAFIVMSPYQNSTPRTIVAAEVFVGNDPGIGNGVLIPLPVDGAWDEGTENVAHVFTGFDVGYYRVGFRTQDNLGRWSAAEYDSLLVGPALTIFVSGNDAVLSWQFPDGIDQYYVYRSANVGGPFNVIDSTALRNYTDPGVFSTQDKGFYYVTFRDDSISLRRPGGLGFHR